MGDISPLDLASRLRLEADDVLQLIGLERVARTYGTLAPTGSYFLDTMVYPDIDKGLTDFAQVTRSLVENGVRIG